MVVPCLEDSAWKYAEVGKQIAAHDFCKWLFSASLRAEIWQINKYQQQ